MKVTDGAKVFIRNKELNKFLLVLRDNKPDIIQPNTWGLIGGGIDEGETPEQTAFRELNEELHLKPKKLFFLEKYVLKNPYEKLLAYLYWFKTTGKARKSSEAAAIKLLMPKEFGMLIRRGMVTSDAAKNFRIGRKKKLF